MNFLEKNKRKFDKLDSPENEGDNYKKLIKLEEEYDLKLPAELKLLYSFLEEYEINPDYCYLSIDILDTEIEFDGFYPILTKQTQEETFFSGLKPKSYPGDELAKTHKQSCGEYPEGWSADKKNDYMPLAESSSDVILMGIGTTNYGEIFLWEFHGDEIENPTKIFSSLPEMIDSFIEY